MALIMTIQQIINELSRAALETGKILKIKKTIFKSKILND